MKTALSALADVLTECRRQKEVEGYDAAHDDTHRDGSLAQAAACYASNAAEFWNKGYGGRPYWPFDEEWWKPKDKRRDLVRAAALILAEIERLDRASTNDAAGEQNNG